MKKLILFLFIAILSCEIFSENATIHSVLVSDFLKDEKDILRYQPLNIFDGNSATVFALTVKQLNPSEPLLKIYLANPVEIDSLEIKAGYFDSRYFSLNHRIKKLRVTVKNAQTTAVDDASFLLKDEMKAQKLAFPKTVKATEIYIYIDDVFKGKKWNDLVISDLSFYKGALKYGIEYGTGGCATVHGEAHYSRVFDEKHRLLSEQVEYGRAGWKEVKYFYNEFAQMIKKEEQLEDNKPEITLYTYKTTTDKFPVNVQVSYNPDGTIKTTTEKVNEVTKTSYYKGGFCIAEDDGENFIYWNYENGVRKFGMYIVSKNNFKQYQVIEYDSNGNPKSEVWFAHDCDLEYFSTKAY